MKTIKIPKALREFFGVEVTLFELTLILITTVVLSALLLVTTFNEWHHLSLWRIIFLALITIDEAGGVISNFSFSTNLYYKTRSKARIKFILIHIQPLIMAFLLRDAYLLSIAVIVYTTISALVINALYKYPAQRMVGVTFMVLGVATLLLTADDKPVLLLALFSIHMFKVIYAFSVDHYQKRG